MSITGQVEFRNQVKNKLPDLNRIESKVKNEDEKDKKLTSMQLVQEKIKKLNEQKESNLKVEYLNAQILMLGREDDSKENKEDWVLAAESKPGAQLNPFLNIRRVNTSNGIKPGIDKYRSDVNETTLISQLNGASDKKFSSSAATYEGIINISGKNSNVHMGISFIQPVNNDLFGSEEYTKWTAIFRNMDEFKEAIVPTKVSSLDNTIYKVLEKIDFSKSGEMKARNTFEDTSRSREGKVYSVKGREVPFWEAAKVFKEYVDTHNDACLTCEGSEVKIEDWMTLDEYNKVADELEDIGWTPQMDVPTSDKEIEEKIYKHKKDEKKMEESQEKLKESRTKTDRKGESLNMGNAIKMIGKKDESIMSLDKDAYKLLENFIDGKLSDNEMDRLVRRFTYGAGEIHFKISDIGNDELVITLKEFSKHLPKLGNEESWKKFLSRMEEKDLKFKEDFAKEKGSKTDEKQKDAKEIIRDMRVKAQKDLNQIQKKKGVVNDEDDKNDKKTLSSAMKKKRKPKKKK